MHPKRILALPLLAASLVLAYCGLQVLQLDLRFSAVDTELSFWGRENYRPGENTIERTGRELSSLLQAQPNHPELLARQAYYLSWLGYFATGVDERLGYNRQALEVQRSALEQRPAYRQGWLEMLEYASRASGQGETIIEVQQRLESLSMYEVQAP